jgi:replication initiation and membrane attachment protein DnaB
VAGDEWARANLMLRIRVVASAGRASQQREREKKSRAKKKKKEKETTVYRRSNLADWRGQSDVRKRDEDSQLAVSDDNARRRATVHSSPRGVSSSRR